MDLKKQPVKKGSPPQVKADPHISAHDKEQFNIAYHRSRPMVDGAHLIAWGRELSEQDHRQEFLLMVAQKFSAIIDNEIDILQKDPYDTMYTRLHVRSQEYVNNCLMQPTTGPTKLTNGKAPAGCIKSSVSLHDYLPTVPARHYSESEYRKLEKWLNENGFTTGNDDNGARFILHGDADTADANKLSRPAGPGNHEPTIFAGALVHYGHVINRTGKIWDSEYLAYIVDKAQDISEVADYLGIDLEIGATNPDEVGTQELMDDEIGAIDTTLSARPGGPWREPAPGSNPYDGKTHVAPDETNWVCVAVTTGFLAHMAWHPDTVGK